MLGQQRYFHSESAKKTKRAWLPDDGTEHPICSTEVWMILTGG